MAKKTLRWLLGFMADLICAAPARPIDPEIRDGMPRAVASADLACPYFLVMLDRDAGWYLDRISPDGLAGRQ